MFKNQEAFEASWEITSKVWCTDPAGNVRNRSFKPDWIKGVKLERAVQSLYAHLLFGSTAFAVTARTDKTSIAACGEDNFWINCLSWTACLQAALNDLAKWVTFSLSITTPEG